MSRLRQAFGESEARSWPDISLDDWINFFNFDGNLYQTWGALPDDEAATDIEGLVRQVYTRNGVAAACMFIRMAVFSEAHFRYRRQRDGKPGELFDDRSLNVLKRPWPGAKTGSLTKRMLLDADIAGNSFTALRRGPRLRRMRPDWTTVVLGIPDEISAGEFEEIEGDVADELDAEVLGYGYHPGGLNSSRDPMVLLREEVAHFAPLPDPLSSWRGMSWLEPIRREVSADNQATTHKAKFFKNAATPNLVVKLNISDPDKFEKFVQLFNEQHEGAQNAYKTLFFGAGAETAVVGQNFQQMAFRDTIGVGEARIAMAGGVPATILGTTEGLQGSSLNAGNYGQARRRFSDGTMRPLWRDAANALEHLVAPPADSELWYDGSDIAFLQEDEKDDAEIRQMDATTISQLVSIGGFTPESSVDAVTSGDLTRLEHSGLIPVQQQPAKETDDD